jgi:hypothetical protein
MLDDLERLRTIEPLRLLLAHYSRLEEPNREIWHPRLMALDGVEPPELSKLHGLLIAMDFIELSVGDVACKYRVTVAGLRALPQVVDSEHVGDEVLAVSEKVTKPFRRKREKKLVEEAACTTG